MSIDQYTRPARDDNSFSFRNDDVLDHRRHGRCRFFKYLKRDPDRCVVLDGDGEEVEVKINDLSLVKSSPHRAWSRRSKELAEWVMRRMVNRTDVYGRYRTEASIAYLQKKKGQKKGIEYTQWGKLTLDKLTDHFRAKGREGLMGLHPITPDNTTLWCGVDIDQHGDDPKTGRINRAAALAWYRRLVEGGFTPLLTDSNGKGGYHLRVLFSSPVAAEAARSFLTSLVSDYGDHGMEDKPELFPKQSDLRKCREGVGNFMRLPGRHPKRDHWTKAWGGRAWLEGDQAVDLILSLEGDPPHLLTRPPVTTSPRLPGKVRPQAANQGEGRQVNVDGVDRTDLGVRVCRPFTSSPCKASSTPLTDDQWDTIRKLCRKHQPKKVGRRNRKQFHLAQAVKGVKADCTPGDLKVVFDVWWKGAKNVVGTKNEDFNFAEFRRAYKLCHSPGGFSWDEQLRLSEGDPLPPEAEVYPDGFRDLIKVLVRVQRTLGDNPFHLSCEQAAQLMGVKSSRTGWKALNTLCDDGVLEQVEVGSKREEGKRGKASKFRCLLVRPDQP